MTVEASTWYSVTCDTCGSVLMLDSGVQALSPTARGALEDAENYDWATGDPADPERKDECFDCWERRKRGSP